MTPRPANATQSSHTIDPPKVVALIPARWASVRFPGKPLALLEGRPIIVHVCEQASKSRHVQRVIVATDDARIAETVTRAGFESRMTRSDHVNGTSRIAEVAATLEADMFVNVQGDEPLIEPSLIDLAVEALTRAGEGVPMSTVASPFMPDEDANDPNLVKVAVGANGLALYFSRSKIPFHRVGLHAVSEPLKHVGLYVYRREFLPLFAGLHPTPLEQTEQLEQLRALEHGHSICVVVGTARYHGVDTPQQLEKLQTRSIR